MRLKETTLFPGGNGCEQTVTIAPRTGADPYDALAKLGTVNEAVEYNPEKAKELAAEFMEALELDLNRVTYISYYLRLACAGL